MMASARIRCATPEDAEAITFIYMQSAELHARLDPDRNHVPDQAEIEERYRTGAQHPEDAKASITLVAEDAGRLVGFLDARIIEAYDAFDPMYRPATYCFVADVGVDEERRREGIGRALMHAIEQWAQEWDADFLLLEYHVGNTPAATLYERLGFRSGSMVACKRLGS